MNGYRFDALQLTEQLRLVAAREELSRFHLIGIFMGGSVAQNCAGTCPQMVDVHADLFHRGIGRADDPDVQNVHETFETFDNEGHALTCKVLAMLDAREQTREAAKWMNKTIPGSRFVEVPVAGHVAVRERPAFVVEQLQSFLDEPRQSDLRREARQSLTIRINYVIYAGTEGHDARSPRD